MEFSLDGKVALVTGGSRGIGKAIARTFAEAGARVMITSRKAEVCAEACEEIGHGSVYEPGHVGREEDAQRVITRTISELGGLDILVNNAATNPYAGPTIDVDRARWDKTMDLNLTAPLVWTQLAWRERMSEHGGSVVNVSSVAGLSTDQALGVYGITKAALLHLTRQLGTELAPKVRVNAIAPGLIRTDFARMLWEGDRGDEVARAYPLQRLGEPEDIAEAALYLCTERSSWMTGQTLVLDGGGLNGFRTIA